MAALVLVLSFFQVWLHFLVNSLQKQVDFSLAIRQAFVFALTLFCFLVLVVTEVLGAVHLLAFGPLLLIWCAISGMHAFFLYRNTSLKFITAKFKLPGLLTSEKIVLCLAGIIIAATLLIALAAPPNGWDSMTYHMARVAHWMDNQSVNHYPTHIIRQLFQPPFAEFLILHFQILTGSDYLANSVEWIFFIGSLCTVSLLVKLLGGNRFLQISSLLIASSIPMVILHSSSTQNDLVMGFWSLAFVYYTLSIVFENRINTTCFFLAGISLGCGLLTKGTAYLYLSPVLLFLIIYVLIKKRALIIPIMFLLIVGLIINLPHYYRNYEIFGDPLGGTAEVRALYANEVHGVSAVASNLIRNTALHLSTPIPGVNCAMNSFLVAIHNKILHISINDPGTTYVESDFAFGKYGLGFHEVSSSNFIHTLLILISCPAIIIFRKRAVRLKPTLLLLFLNVIAAIFFCYYLKWQESYSRLHTPLFLLFVPLITLTFNLITNNAKMILLVLLFMGAIPWILFNNLRPLISHGQIGPVKAQVGILANTRDNVRFENRIEIKPDYNKAVQEIMKSNASLTGLLIQDNDWDYPFWQELRSSGYKGGLIHVNVSNPSRKLEEKNERPSGCIATTFYHKDTLVSVNCLYLKSFKNKTITLFSRERN